MYKHAYRVLISKGGEARILALNQHDSLRGRLDLVFRQRGAACSRRRSQRESPP